MNVLQCAGKMKTYDGLKAVLCIYMLGMRTQEQHYFLSVIDAH